MPLVLEPTPFTDSDRLPKKRGVVICLGESSLEHAVELYYMTFFGPSGYRSRQAFKFNVEDILWDLRLKLSRPGPARDMALATWRGYL